MKRYPPWASALLKTHAASATFAGALDEQLVRAAEAAAGVDLGGGGFMLFIELGEQPLIECSDSGEQVVHAHLLAPDHFAHDVSIAWRCTTHPAERVLPSETPSPECCLKFRWIDLPDDDFRARFSGPVPPRDPIGGPYPFVVETWHLAGKDLFLELIRADPYEEASMAQTIARLRSSEFPLGSPLLSSTSIQLPIDLADHTLAEILSLLAAAPSLRLTKVIVRSFPIGDAAYDP
jgi:hypothetical protein